MRQKGRPKDSELIDWNAVPLGSVPDTEVAEQLGCSQPAVRKQRVKRGIPAVRQRRWADWDNIPLGRIPDAEAGRLAGRTKESACEARERRQIPRFYGRCTCITTEGEFATLPEARIDLLFHERGKDHKFQVPIAPYVADWVCGNQVVEFAGLLAHRNTAIRRKYQLRLTRKKKHYESLGYSVLVIKYEDLANYTPLGAVRYLYACRLCGSNSRGFTKGLCRRCYSLNRPKTICPRSGAVSCLGCSRTFGTPGQKRGLVRHVGYGLCQKCYTARRSSSPA